MMCPNSLPIPRYTHSLYTESLPLCTVWGPPIPPTTYTVHSVPGLPYLDLEDSPRMSGAGKGMVDQEEETISNRYLLVGTSFIHRVCYPKGTPTPHHDL